jgi:hypothetical protein
MKLPKQVRPVIRSMHSTRSSGNGLAPSRLFPDEPPIHLPPPLCHPNCLSHVLSCDGAADMNSCLLEKGAIHCLNCYWW